MTDVCFVGGQEIEVAAQERALKRNAAYTKERCLRRCRLEWDEAIDMEGKGSERPPIMLAEPACR